MSSETRPIITFGPKLPGWGSWDWLGLDTACHLAKQHSIATFAAWDIPNAAIVCVIKHPPPQIWINAIKSRSALVYWPVDHYPSVNAIDADASFLRACQRIVVHCRRLHPYFASYAPTEYLDHHVKYVADAPREFSEQGNLLWVGVRSNLPPLIDWIEKHRLPAVLDILTNFENPNQPPTLRKLGFSRGIEDRIAIHNWSPEAHLQFAAKARGFIDIKGDDFRSRHKPPAKGIDAIASGLPVAMNSDSSTVEHLAQMGFEVPDPSDVDYWLSREYWEETQRFGAALRELLSIERVGRRFSRIIDEILQSGRPS